MESSRSFYLGPKHPTVRINTWAQLAAAADSGGLQENQWVECKQDVPKGESANRELAKDLASCGVEGGVIVIGAADKIRDASGLVGVENADGLRERIGQVAHSRIKPPLHVVIDSLSVEHGSRTRTCLLVVVPASVDAPHMVADTYWGRSATGKRPLTDHEVRRLFADRVRRADDFEQQLLSMTDTFDPVADAERQHGHIYLYARPVVPPAIMITDLLETTDPYEWITEALPGEPAYYPMFGLLKHRVPHANGLMFTSLPEAAQHLGDDIERYMIQVLVEDTGGVRVTSGHGTSTRGQGSEQQRCISPNYHLELAHETVGVAARTLATYTGYHGVWDLGVHATGLRGLQSTYAIDKRNWQFTRRPFQTDSYTSTTTAETAEMLSTPAAVVERLYKRFTRGLGLHHHLFPYSTFAEISERNPRDDC